MAFQTLFFWLLILVTSVLSKSTRIIGGSNADILEYPYIAALVRIDNNVCKCAGAIVSKRNIITAAHCFVKYNNVLEEVKFIAGNADLSRAIGSNLFLEKVYMHIDFGVMADRQVPSYRNDIAIAKVRETIQFGRFLNKVSLPTADVHSGDIGMVSGWGMKSYPPQIFPDILQDAWMRIYDRNICRSWYPLPVHEDQFCAYQKPGVGPCLGDSGAPLVISNIIVGIASTCVPCALGFPDIYTNIFLHINFIRNLIIE